MPVIYFCNASSCFGFRKYCLHFVAKIQCKYICVYDIIISIHINTFKYFITSPRGTTYILALDGSPKRLEMGIFFILFYFFSADFHPQPEIGRASGTLSKKYSILLYALRLPPASSQALIALFKTSLI